MVTAANLAAGRTRFTVAKPFVGVGPPDPEQA